MLNKNAKTKRSYFTSPKKEPLVKKMILDPHESIPPVSCFDLRPINQNESNQQDIIFDPKSSSMKEISDFQKNSPHEFDKIIYGLNQQNTHNDHIFLNNQRLNQFSNQLQKEQQPNQCYSQNSNSFKRDAPFNSQASKKYQNVVKIFQSLDQSQQYKENYYRVTYDVGSPVKRSKLLMEQRKRKSQIQSTVKLQEQDFQRDQHMLAWSNQQQIQRTVKIEKAWPERESSTPHQSKKKVVRRFADSAEFELINQYTELMSYTSLIEDLITVYDKSPLFEFPLDFESDPEDTNHEQGIDRYQSNSSIEKEKQIFNDSSSHQVKVQELSVDLEGLRFDSDGSQTHKNNKDFFTLLDKMRIDQAPENKKNTVKKQIKFQRSKTYLNFYQPIQEIRPFIKKMNIDEKMLFLSLKKELKQIKDIIEYFDKRKNSQKREHVCKICGQQFDNGRQLGGHMSRKHPGKAMEYVFKKELRKVKEIERNRRKYFKNSKREIKQDEQDMY